VYFDPGLHFDSPFASEEEPIVFTGAMDYWANVDAVRWFAEEILPLIRKSRANARFYIVGSRPAEAVRTLASEGVVVTGTVPDVRPYLSHSRVVVAPLRIARGIQNKVLEALSMARPVVATDDALDGLDAVREAGAVAANDPQGYAAAVTRYLSQFGSEPKARRYVQDKFGWEASLTKLDALLRRAQ
jgi:glycosyltransferase involved in cell wall biosynthesis